MDRTEPELGTPTWQQAPKPLAPVTPGMLETKEDSKQRTPESLCFQSSVPLYPLTSFRAASSTQQACREAPDTLFRSYFPH